MPTNSSPFSQASNHRDPNSTKIQVMRSNNERITTLITAAPATPTTNAASPGDPRATTTNTTTNPTWAACPRNNNRPTPLQICRKGRSRETRSDRVDHICRFIRHISRLLINRRTIICEWIIMVVVARLTISMTDRTMLIIGRLMEGCRRVIRKSRRIIRHRGWCVNCKNTALWCLFPT
jgi:hypothetical protein